MYLKGTICHQAAFLLTLHIWDFQLLHLMQWAAALFSSGDIWVSFHLGCLSQWHQYLVSSAFSSTCSICASCKAWLASEPRAYLSFFHSHSSMEIKDPRAEVLQQGLTSLDTSSLLPQPVLSYSKWKRLMDKPLIHIDYVCGSEHVSPSMLQALGPKHSDWGSVGQHLCIEIRMWETRGKEERSGSYPSLPLTQGWGVGGVWNQVRKYPQVPIKSFFIVY